MLRKTSVLALLSVVAISHSVLADDIIIIRDRSSISGEVVGIDKVIEPGVERFERQSEGSLSMQRKSFHAELLAKKFTRITTNQIAYVDSPVVQTVCSAEVGEGRGNWHGFYNTGSFEAQAKALEDSILGVGKNLSKPLVKYFADKKKPRTWEAFSGIIRRADKEIGHGLAKNVLSNYGQENASNLGYYDAAICSQVIRMESLPVLVENTYKILDDTIRRSVDVVIDPQDSVDPRSTLLLPGERESIVVTFDGQSTSVRVDNATSSYESRQDRSGRNLEIRLINNGRLERAAKSPNGLNVTFEKDPSGRVILVVTNDLFDYDKLVKPELTLTAQFKREAFGFDKKLALQAYKLNSALRVQKIRTDVQFDSEKAIYVEYSVARVGEETNHYSNEKSSSQESKHYR